MNGVTGVGAGSSGLVLLGAVFGVVIAVVQQWVYVELPVNVSGQLINYCSGPYLGTIGLYQSTFDPACVATSGADATTKAFFAQFKKTASATTDFWPLFPTQTAYGGFFGTVPAFDGNCTTYYGAGGAVYPAAASYVTNALYSQATVGLQNNLQTFTTELSLGNAYFNSTWAGQTQTAFTQIGQLLTLVQGVAQASVALATGTCSGAHISCSPGGANILTAPWTTNSTLVFAGALTSQFGWNSSLPLLSNLVGVTFALPTTLEAKFNGTLYNATLVNAQLLAVYIPLQNATIYASVRGMLQVIAGAAAAYPLTGFLPDVGGTTSIMLPNFINYYTMLKIVTSGSAPSASTSQLFQQIALFKACTLLGATTDAACITGYNGVPFADQFTTYSPLCTLLVGNAASNATLYPLLGYNFTTGCSDFSMLTIPSYTAVLLSLFPSGSDSPLALLVQAFPTIVYKLATCVAGGFTTLTQCLNLNSNVYPADYTSANYPLCLGLAVDTVTKGGNGTDVLVHCNSFADLIRLTPALNSVFGAVCLNNGITVNTTCFAYLVAGGSSQALGAFVDSTNSSTAIQSCTDTQEDARRIQLAQKMVPAGIAMTFLGLFAGLGFVVMPKAPVAAVGGILSLVGGVLMLVALLTVKGAPVYQKVGLPPVNEKPLYINGPAATMGYLAIFLPILGGLGLLGAAVMALMGMGASSGEAKSTEMAAKVENEA